MRRHQAIKIKSIKKAMFNNLSSLNSICKYASKRGKEVYETYIKDDEELNLYENYLEKIGLPYQIINPDTTYRKISIRLSSCDSYEEMNEDIEEVKV